MDLFWFPSATNTAAYDFTYRKGIAPYTLVEQRYLLILNDILNKRGWRDKITDTNTTTKWRNEISQMKLSDTDIVEPGDVDRLFSHLLQELHFYSDSVPVTYSPTGMHGVTISDSLIQPPLLANIQLLLRPLELDAIRRRDFHPGSNDLVIDVVHPSMYCLVYGRTMFSRNPCSLAGDDIFQWKETPGDHARLRSRDISTKSQWIPADVTVSQDGANVTFESYINGLKKCADNRELYECIETVLKNVLPLLEIALQSRDIDVPQRIPEIDSIDSPDRDEWARGVFELYKQGLYPASTTTDGAQSNDEPRLEIGSEILQSNDNGQSEESDDSQFDEFCGTILNEDDRPVSIPMLPARLDTERLSALVVRPNNALSGRRLQVIVKVATIRLTPEAPTYGGGKWHIEGMENEAIVATAILYYSCSNITQSKLSFRHAYDSDSRLPSYEQYDWHPIEKVPMDDVRLQLCA